MAGTSAATKIEWPTKDELQKLVWSMPTSILAQKLGVSDVAIAKRCRNLRIKKPPRGYWQKLAVQKLPMYSIEKVNRQRFPYALLKRGVLLAIGPCPDRLKQLQKTLETT